MKHMRGGIFREGIEALKKEATDMYPLNLPRRIVDRIKQPFLPCGCWEVTGWDDGKGYKKMRVNNSAHYVHRVVYELLVGEFPHGLVLHHLCYNRCCCNPLHLAPVTVQFNTRDGAAVLFGDH